MNVDQLAEDLNCKESNRHFLPISNAHRTILPFDCQTVGTNHSKRLFCASTRLFACDECMIDVHA